MTITVKVHPLADLVASCLHAVDTLPQKEQRRAFSNAAKQAAKWHDEEIARFVNARDELRKWLEETTTACGTAKRGRQCIRCGHLREVIDKLNELEGKP